MHEFPIIGVRGKNHREMGRVLGEQLESAIRDILAEQGIPEKFDSAAQEALISNSFQQRMRRYAPELLEEMKGIAEGTGIPTKQIFIYNDLPEMWQANAFVPSAAQGCTALGFQDSPMGPIIGKNNDIGENKAKYHIPHRYTFPDGSRALIFTWPGTVWANAFVNQWGLSCGGASVTSATVDPSGLPSNFKNRIVAQRANGVEKALEIEQALPISSHAYTAVLADEKRLVGLEVGVGGLAVIEPSKAACWGVNHFTQPDMPARQKLAAQLMANSWARWARLEELANSTDHTVEGVKSILAYHAEWGSICQHGKGPSGMHTSASYVMIPTQRRIEFAYGKPCETPWVDVSML